MSKKFRDPLQDIRVSKVFRQQVVPVKRDPIKLTKLDDLCQSCFELIEDCDCSYEEAYQW